MKNYSFKISSNIMSFITKTAVSCSVSSIKNTDILHESVIKIRNVIYVQFQNTIIIIVFFKINQKNISNQFSVKKNNVILTAKFIFIQLSTTNSQVLMNYL